jgi:hypothetical protein
MQISQNQLQRIIMEEYSRAKRAQRLTEGTQMNPIQMDPQMLKRIIIEESFKMQQQNKPLQVTPQMLRQMIMQESRKLGR